MTSTRVMITQNLATELGATTGAICTAGGCEYCSGSGKDNPHHCLCANTCCPHRQRISTTWIATKHISSATRRKGFLVTNDICTSTSPALPGFCQKYVRVHGTSVVEDRVRRHMHHSVPARLRFKRFFSSRRAGQDSASIFAIQFFELAHLSFRFRKVFGAVRRWIPQRQ